LEPQASSQASKVAGRQIQPKQHKTCQLHKYEDQKPGVIMPIPRGYKQSVKELRKFDSCHYNSREIGFHVENHATQWHGFQHEIQFQEIVVAWIQLTQTLNIANDPCMKY